MVITGEQLFGVSMPIAAVFFNLGVYFHRRYKRLVLTVHEQRLQILALEKKTVTAALSAAPQRLAIEKDIKRLIAEFHPDTNPKGVDATKVVMALNQLRGVALGKGARR